MNQSDPNPKFRVGDEVISTQACAYRCHEIGGPWIEENPECPIHGVNKVTYDSGIIEKALELIGPKYNLGFGKHSDVVSAHCQWCDMIGLSKIDHKDALSNVGHRENCQWVSAVQMLESLPT